MIKKKTKAKTLTMRSPLFYFLERGTLTAQVPDITEIGQDREINLLIRNGLVVWRHDDHQVCETYGKTICNHNHYLYMTIKALNYFGQSFWTVFKKSAKTSKLRKITKHNFLKKLALNIFAGVE